MVDLEHDLEHKDTHRKRRISAQELTAERVISALRRRVGDVPHRFAWNASRGRSLANRERLLDYRDRHRGQRCFILGNGPSLAKMDLRPLAGEWTFGMNRIYLLFEQMGFLPSYYCAANDLVIDQFAQDIAALSMPKFLNWNGRSHFDPNDASLLFLRQALTLSDFFGRDLARPICSGGTVTFLALQVAYYMGFQQVVLIGVDHNFVDKGTPNRAVTRTAETDENHFHPDYFPKGSRWQLPDLLRSEEAYRLAREAYQADGREIVDATVGGALEVFDKADYSDLVEFEDDADGVVG
ncbi:MAG: DUF115 domain-containing protein [Myxococcales bacterium]|nr:DUF115 domain-containing protein [Myxococcales bacterium]